MDRIEPHVSAAMPSAQQALAGRIPIPYQDRVYQHYGGFLLTCATLGAASYAYLVGVSLATIGTTWVGVLGYLLGMIIGTAFVAFTVGSVSYRFGVDTVDGSKFALGSRGAIFVLLSVIVTCGGWANVLLAMTARGMVNLFPEHSLAAGIQTEWAVIAVGIGLIVMVWVLLRRGTRMMERAAAYGAIAQILVAVMLLYFIADKFGIAHTLMTNVGPEKAYTGDRLLQIAYAVEFGVANGLSMFPFFGGMARLVKHRRNLIGPAVVGLAIVGCAFVSAVGALASVATGQDELSALLNGVAGAAMGHGLLGIILIANVGTMVAQFYVVGLAVQQITLFARLRWEVVAAVILLPSFVAVVRTQWLLDHVITFVAYSGVVFAGVTAIMFVDYFALRRQRVVATYLFALPGQGSYWFFGGFNWAAILVIVLSSILYLSIFDPVTLRTSGPFRVFGASVPTLVTSALAYYALMKILVLKRGIGGYSASAGQPEPVRVGL